MPAAPPKATARPVQRQSPPTPKAFWLIDRIAGGHLVKSWHVHPTTLRAAVARHLVHCDGACTIRLGPGNPDNRNATP